MFMMCSTREKLADVFQSFEDLLCLRIDVFFRLSVFEL